MSTTPASEEIRAALSDEDLDRIDAILKFWFKEKSLSAPQIDQRMDTWFGEDSDFDEAIRTRFRDDVERASSGEFDHWTSDSRGRLALILLLDQFRRNIFRNTGEAFAKDGVALKLCLEGAMHGLDKSLAPIERAFFYMPLQHAESKRVQAKSCELFEKLAAAVSPTYRETFDTMAQFAELHRDIVDQFGRFPHRNKLLGRDNTPEEDEYLSGDAPDFGQG
ncbi:MAG: DUF924 family protein [Pseudomonadota bacterium]